MEGYDQQYADGGGEASFSMRLYLVNSTNLSPPQHPKNRIPPRLI
jgi:hypothetical protein